MPNLIQAADQVKALALTFQSVIDLAAAAGELGSIEQAQGEAQRRLDATRADLAAASDALAATQDALKSRQDKASTELDAAKAEAARIIADAKDKAQHDTAHAQDAIRRRSDAAVQAHAKGAAKLADLDAQIAAKTTELADLNARVEQVRATVAQMLGAAAA